jgi:hypothetical protein
MKVKHSVGDGTNTYVFIETPLKRDIRKLDMLNCQGHSVSAKRKWDVVKSIIHDGDFITNMELPLFLG